jgi:hypothetical protein
MSSTGSSGMRGDQAKPRVHAAIAACLALAGFYLRAHFYAADRSLWLDEASLAVNLVTRSFLGLLEPLDLNQGAPTGFLLLQKTIILLLGNRDYILRLAPLLAGLITIPLVHKLTLRYSWRLPALLALGLLALSPKHVYYSSEAKQYASDALWAVLLLLLLPESPLGGRSSRRLVALGLVGAAAIWFSHPSVFVLAGILLALVVSSAVEGRRSMVPWLVGIAAIWAISFGLTYLVSLRHLAANRYLLEYWDGSFAPLPPWDNPRWYYNAVGVLLDIAANLPANAVTVGLLILGGMSLLLRRYPIGLAVGGAVLATLVASALGKYPFEDRMILFLVPIVAVALAEGVGAAWSLLAKASRVLAWVGCAALVGYLVLPSLRVARETLQRPPLGEHIKPIMAHLGENLAEEDLVYVYYAAGPAFEYYAPQYGIRKSSAEIGAESREEPAGYLKEVDALRGNSRVWFVFTHNCPVCPVNEQRYIVGYLDQIGQRIGGLSSNGADAYLYDLDGQPG